MYAEHSWPGKRDTEAPYFWPVKHGKRQEVYCQTSIFRISSLLPSPAGSAVNNLPAMQETWVQALRDPLEKGMATHSRIFAWNVPRTEEPGGPQPVGLQRVGCHWATNTFIFTLPSPCTGLIAASPGWKATTSDLQNNSPFNSIFSPLDFNLPNTFHLYFAWFFLNCIGQHSNKEWERWYVSNGLDLTTDVTVIMKAVESRVAMKAH